MKSGIRGHFFRDSLAAVFAAGVMLLGTGVLPASAAIQCDGRFQLIRGIGWHTSNYCENTYLARIARSYGWKVSNYSVRENPALKEEICRHIGFDTRLIGICGGSGNGNDYYNDVS